MNYSKLYRRGYTIGTSIIDFLSAIGYCFITHLQPDGNYTFSVQRVSLAEGIECLYESKQSYPKDEVEKVALQKTTELC